MIVVCVELGGLEFHLRKRVSSANSCLMLLNSCVFIAGTYIVNAAFDLVLAFVGGLAYFFS